MNKSQMIISNGLKYFSTFVDLLLLFVHCTLSYAFLQHNCTNENGGSIYHF